MTIELTFLILLTISFSSGIYISDRSIEVKKTNGFLLLFLTWIIVFTLAMIGNLPLLDIKRNLIPLSIFKNIPLYIEFYEAIFYTILCLTFLIKYKREVTIKDINPYWILFSFTCLIFFEYILLPLIFLEIILWLSLINSKKNISFIYIFTSLLVNIYIFQLITLPDSYPPPLLPTGSLFTNMFKGHNILPVLAFSSILLRWITIVIIRKKMPFSIFLVSFVAIYKSVYFYYDSLENTQINENIILTVFFISLGTVFFYSRNLKNNLKLLALLTSFSILSLFLGHINPEKFLILWILSGTTYYFSTCEKWREIKNIAGLLLVILLPIFIFIIIENKTIEFVQQNKVFYSLGIFLSIYSIISFYYTKEKEGF